MLDLRLLRTAVACAVFVIALVTYVLTLAPGTGFVDSGHLTVAAMSLGNAHPPGFPLYLAVTHLFTLLPLGTVAMRANVASALFAAGACALLALCVGEALRAASERQAAARDHAPHLPLAAAMLVGGLLLAFSRTLWSWATIAEVYALNTFLLVLVLWLSLIWRRTRSSALAYAVAAVSGLALGVHHLTVGLTLLGIATFFALAGGKGFLRSRTLLACLAIFVVALIAVYAYLPLAASSDPEINWGNPDSVRRVIDHVAAKEYYGYVRSGKIAAQVADVARVIRTDLGLAGLPLLLAGLGLWHLLRNDRLLFFAIVISAVPICAWVLFYPIANDEEAYLLPLFVFLALAAGIGTSSLVGRRPAFALLVALPLAAAVLHWPERDRSAFIAPRLAAENVLRSVAPNALVITNNQFIYGALLYHQKAETMRPDVGTLQFAQLSRSWYLDTAGKRHPALFGRVRNELEAFRKVVEQVEAQGSPNADAALMNDLLLRFYELVLALIRTQLESGGRVYTTFDLAYEPDDLAAPLAERLPVLYDIVPRGLAFELVRGRSADRAMSPIDNRNLTDGSTFYEPNDVVRTSLIPTYRGVLHVRGRQLVASGQYAAAAIEYRKALELDPSDSGLAENVRRLEQRARE